MKSAVSKDKPIISRVRNWLHGAWCNSRSNEFWNLVRQSLGNSQGRRESRGGPGKSSKFKVYLSNLLNMGIQNTTTNRK